MRFPLHTAMRLQTGTDEAQKASSPNIAGRRTLCTITIVGGFGGFDFERGQQWQCVPASDNQIRIGIMILLALEFSRR